ETGGGHALAEGGGDPAGDEEVLRGTDLTVGGAGQSELPWFYSCRSSGSPPGKAAGGSHHPRDSTLTLSPLFSSSTHEGASTIIAEYSPSLTWARASTRWLMMIASGTMTASAAPRIGRAHV